MRDHQNIKDLVKLAPDYIGFIFYPKSPRYAGNSLSPDITSLIPAPIRKTGVFVNENTATILDICKKYQLDAVQLHGSESPEQCKALKDQGLEIIKVFSLKKTDDSIKTEAFRGVSDFFLFDTPTSEYGGSGKKFDWSLLSGLNPERPFFLSGGIAPADADKILEECPLIPYALDINSQFESSPGFKNLDSVKKFINSIRNQ